MRLRESFVDAPVAEKEGWYVTLRAPPIRLLGKGYSAEVRVERRVPMSAGSDWDVQFERGVGGLSALEAHFPGPAPNLFLFRLVLCPGSHLPDTCGLAPSSSPGWAPAIRRRKTRASPLFEYGTWRTVCGRPDLRLVPLA